MENPIKIDDLGVPLFLETPISQKLVRKTLALADTAASAARSATSTLHVGKPPVVPPWFLWEGYHPHVFVGKEVK